MNKFDSSVKQLLEDFNIYPKPGRRVYATGKSDSQGMTSGDMGAAVFNSPKEIDLSLPTPKELKAKRRAKKSR